MKQSSRKRLLAPHIDSAICIVRGERVIFDADLAEVYLVSTKRLNEQIRRNIDRFPDDFCFQITAKEWKEVASLRSQNATLKRGRGQHRKYLPYAFTEHGAIMAANVLNSKRAVQMSIFVVRAFIRMRRTLNSDSIFVQKLKNLEKKLASRLNSHEHAIRYVLSELRKLMEPPDLPEPKHRSIGFGRGDKAAL